MLFEMFKEIKLTISNCEVHNFLLQNQYSILSFRIKMYVDFLSIRSINMIYIFEGILILQA